MSLAGPPPRDEPRRPILLLLNPASGAKPGGPSVDRGRSAGDLREGLAQGGMPVELHELAEDDDIGTLAREASTDRDVVVAGGDGTVAPAAAALVGTDATLGIIPLGSYNNIARGTGVPLDLDEALEAIRRGAVRRVDAGLAWHLDEAPAEGAAVEAREPPPEAATFFEAAGVGLDAAGFGVIELGGRRGLVAAVRSAWRALRRRATPVVLWADGRWYRFASPAITICNGPYHGLGFGIAPDADPADGSLDIAVFARMSQLEVLGHFIATARGRRQREPRIRIIRAREAIVGGARRVLPVHVDGRSIGITPVAVTVRPGALRVFVP